jgi:hypothetical protein
MAPLPPKTDLQRMLCSPGSIKDRDIRVALEERGWTMRRSKNEQIWIRGPRMIRVPHSLKSKWTAQVIIKELIQVERSEAEGK